MKKMMMILAACTLLLSGCTKSNIVSGGADYSDLPQPQGGIVWEQLWDDFDEIYTDADIYPFSETVNGGFYDEEKQAKFFLLLNTEISKEEAAIYATTVLKGLGDLISEQNSNYTKSSENSYGSYLDQYEIYVMVAPDGAKDDESTWILEDTIPLGEYQAVDGEE